MSTESVLAHHLESLGAGDVDAILSDYTDDSVLFTPDGSLRGRDAIRPLFQGLV